MPDPKRILVLDDDAAFVDGLRAALGPDRYMVETSLHLGDAWSRLRGSTPDLVLCATALPDVDAHELQRELRQDPDLCNLPFVLVGATPNGEDRIRGLRMGADDFLAKSYEPQEIAARIGTLLGRIDRIRAEARRDARRELGALQQAILGNLSHELRTPVAAILTTLELIAEETFRNAPDQQQMFVQRALANTQLLRRLVDDLIILSKLQAGDLKLLRRPISFRELFHLVDADTRAVQHEFKVRLEIVCEDDVGLNADRERLRLAVTHLIDNALKFSEPGAVVVVTAEAVAEGTVEIRVQDSGLGIQAQHLPHIFERFYQVDSSIRRRYRGMGNGLYIVRKVAQAHGGDVSVRSEPGLGSTFILRLTDAPSDWPTSLPTTR
jgi:signal transduction histidine kinase